MRYLLLLLAACGGPDLSRVVAVYEAEGITLHTELELDAARVTSDVRAVREAFDRHGVSPAEQFAERFGTTVIVVRDAQDLRENDGNNMVTGGITHRQGFSEWVDLNRWGTTLGHELLHVAGICGHGWAAEWQCDPARLADEDLRALSPWVR